MATSAEHLRNDPPLAEWNQDHEPFAFALPDDEAPCHGSTALSSERHFDPDTILFREGAEASSVYAIRGGIVKLVRHLPNGRARIVGMHGPGGVIGLPAGARESPVNPHSAIALGPVDTRCWSSVHMRRLRSEEPERYIELLETLYGQVRQADLWITEFSTGRIRSRVARLILFLERTEDGPSAGEVELLTCQDMGEMLGVTPESVSRIVADMKRRELLVPVATEPVERYLCDMEALQAIARD
jgi:CRP/FNR family transcriptional regulator